METKVSKAQIEVWEWKDLVYEKLKNIPKNLRIEYIINDTKETMSKLKKSNEENKVLI